MNVLGWNVLAWSFPSYLATKMSYIDGTQDPVVRAQREREVLNEFMTRTGAIGTTPGMLNKYFMRSARQVMSKGQLAWTTKTEASILAGRIDEAQSELWTGMTSGNIGSAASNFLETMKSLGKSPLDGKRIIYIFRKQ